MCVCFDRAEWIEIVALLNRHHRGGGGAGGGVGESMDTTTCKYTRQSQASPLLVLLGYCSIEIKASQDESHSIGRANLLNVSEPI